MFNVYKIKQDLTANLGAGRVELDIRRCREPLCIIWVQYTPDHARGKIAVKLEFQRSRRDMTPETQLLVFGAIPTIADRIQSGRLNTRTNIILVAETLAEIMAGKVRALLERESLKGRDFWDIWYLAHSRQVQLNSMRLKRKLEMYPFTLRRSKAEIIRSLTGGDGPVIEAISGDLIRFIPGRTFAALEENQFAPLMAAAREVLDHVPDDLF